MSQIKVNSIVPVAGLSGGASGGIIQIKQTVKTDTSSVTAAYNSPADLGISCAITPSSTSSKILVDCNLVVAGNVPFGMYFWLVRGSTQILLSDASGSRTRSSKYITTYWEGTNASNSYKVGDLNIKYLDSPATTSATTYKIQAGSWNTNAIYLNRCHTNNDGASYDGNSTSTITLYEVSG